MIPVILSGGSGTRLWPMSRRLYPKQFLALLTENTLFQETLDRIKNIENTEAPIIVCNEEHRFIVAENLNQSGQLNSHILLEPAARNTAAAIASAAFYALEKDHDAILVVMPADHSIAESSEFELAIEMAVQQAKDDKIVTFGIKASSPHTGYGYIERGDKISDLVYQVSCFKEKPSKKTAEEFIKKGTYLWNSGIFCFKAKTLIEELQKEKPDIVKCAELSVKKSQKDLDFIRLDKDSFVKCEDISIDYALMEKTPKSVVVECDIEWNDIGSYESLWVASSNKDDNGNVTKGDVILEDSHNNYIIGSDRLVTALGVEDLVIVDTQDALLVSSKERSQEIKKIVKRLEENKRSEPIHHRTVYRPWGHYDSICFGERDQVKRITVKPGAKLSIQKHHHRSEHWVVVKGTANVTKGNEEVLLSENQSIYLPLGIVHALENPGKIPLEIIEVQTGSYLGEDDIIRYEDKYGRA